MQKLFPHPVVLLLLSISFVTICASPTIAGEELNSSIVVDFDSGTVGGVKIRGEIGDIENAIGTSRILKSIEYLEGQESDVYIISFDNHKIFKHWNAFSYNDPIFKTKDGLGIGSKVQDFNQLYGQGRVYFEETFAIYYKIKDIQICVETEFIEGKKQNIDFYANSIVNEVWAW